MDVEKKRRNKARFERELEFVQALANPYYLQTLAQQGLFDNVSFLRYLEYLAYWKEPKYAKFVVFPQSLVLLDALADAGFRQSLLHVETAQMIERDQYARWTAWSVLP